MRILPRGLRCQVRQLDGKNYVKNHWAEAHFATGLPKSSDHLRQGRVNNGDAELGALSFTWRSFARDGGRVGQVNRREASAAKKSAYLGFEVLSSGKGATKCFLALRSSAPIEREFTESRFNACINNALRLSKSERAVSQRRDNIYLRTSDKTLGAYADAIEPIPDGIRKPILRRIEIPTRAVLLDFQENEEVHLAKEEVLTVLLGWKVILLGLKLLPEAGPPDECLPKGTKTQKALHGAHQVSPTAHFSEDPSSSRFIGVCSIQFNTLYVHSYHSTHSS
ncbi:uncharacterized protein BDR25DRAFT_355732 [Lindgomyces ingoldianus]|uniref:Uncharacterized protein n=1 Tax=Lindgomyces ingoldianus TaxID=673940 RepID=A0ACB6QSM0_9PLEO|nr:uncharacterized protein BDR25DRAFT_355732 [Lindgomyces ingoldianus]KAF2470004.1 hypothetical protein BDR25DRAFT_355732 [Lindgomyces ingoldianus]